MKKLILALLLAVPMHAATVANTAKGILVADANAIALHTMDRMLWRA